MGASPDPAQRDCARSDPDRGCVSLDCFPSEKIAEQYRQRIPAGRFGTPAELAELAAYLVSDSAEWMRGEVVTLDGGEWLRGAGEFNELLEAPASMWDELRRRTGR